MILANNRLFSIRGESNVLRVTRNLRLTPVGFRLAGECLLKGYGFYYEGGFHSRGISISIQLARQWSTNGSWKLLFQIGK